MGEIFRGRIITLRQDQVTLPSGHQITLDIVHHPGAAAVVAIDADNAVVLVRQFRHAAGGFIWEVPAGTLGDGEAPDVCARRELEEETGLVAAQWAPLGSIVTTPGFCDERIHLFLARELRETKAALDDDEVLTVSRIPLARAFEMVRQGEIEDAKSIAALHLAQAVLDQTR
jgi:ADP-ribose pyrophosphatase